MKLLPHTCLIMIAGLMLCTALPSNAQQHNQAPEGYTALFDGESLDGWTGGTTEDPRKFAGMSQAELNQHREKMAEEIRKHWRVEDGELISDGHGPHLVTLEEFGDFEFWVDWKLSANGDSGIYLRGCPQVQMWDPNNKAAHKHGSDKGSGGLWNNKASGRFPSEVADKPIGEWNRMYVRMVGAYVTVKLNGVTVIDNEVMENYFDRNLPMFKTGTIHLQTHGSETRFRNVFIRELSAEESNKALAGVYGDEGFTPVFNGNDLDGWIGAVDQYEVVDGAIRCKAGSGGNLVTKQSYSDFVAKLEFKLPPGGNNGLAIRVPGPNVNPAYAGIELQVLDDTAEKYADLKEWQFHGSAYGLAPAIRGYLRPVGEWNYEVVKVIGSNIQVHLNGFMILDIDAAELAKKPIDAKAHPGAMRTEGHFGFCGHNDPVAFRNIAIKEVE